MAKQPSLTKQALPALFTNESNERHDVLVNAIEKITRDYPNLLTERKVFMNLTTFVKVLTGSMRACVFKAFERYLHVCRREKRIEDIDEIAMALFGDAEEIMSDISDENQQAFLQLITHLSKLNVDSGEKLINKILPRLKTLFVGNKNDYSRGLFYDLMVFLYDTFPPMRV